MPTEQQLWAVFECVDEYLEAQEELGKALKEGLFSIARGKYTLGTAFGQQRYPGDMQATSSVQVCPSVDDENVYDEFKLQQLDPVQQSKRPAACETGSGGSSSATVDTHSAPVDGSTAAQQAGTKHDQKQDFNNNPLHWFTALPPQPVRQAQTDFSVALQRAIAAANVVQRLRHLAAGLSSVDDAGGECIVGDAAKD